MTADMAHTQELQGFFLADWKPREAIIPSSTELRAERRPANVHITVRDDSAGHAISPLLSGDNTNPYMTQIVTEPELMDKIRKLAPPILRFPGGNLSNLYFWNGSPDAKPEDVPDTILYGDARQARKSKFWYGRNEAPGTLSLDNYYKLLKETNSEGTICVNAGYARYGLGDDPIATAAHYAADWIRYDKGRTKYWEIGNEDYGRWQAGYRIDTQKNRDDQPEITSGKLYGRIFRAFADSMRQAAKEIGATIYIGATIIEKAHDLPSDNEVDREWNSGFSHSAGNTADFFVIHSYFTPYEENSSPSAILNSARRVTTEIVTYLRCACMQYHVQMKPLALTEWNIFAVHSRQQVSFINAMHAALVLGEMIRQKYGMACRWNLANGYSNGDDHGMFNRGDEPGVPRWSARPAYYCMYYFKQFFGDHFIPTSCSDTSVAVFSSSFSNGFKGLVVVNMDTLEKTASIRLSGAKARGRCYRYVLTGGNDDRSFSRQVVINGIAPLLPAGGPANFETIRAYRSLFKKISNVHLPARSVQFILMK